jgi:predicted TIM-barrel fold metal-dependent hydrolase
VSLTEAANDRLAAAVRKNPSRFGGFAALPWRHPEKAALELRRSIEDLGLVGAMLLGRPGEVFLDDARFEPVLATLNELRVPLYIHPGYPLPQVQRPYYGGLGKEVTARMSLFGWGWHNEAGIQLLRILLTGKFDRYPNLQVISGHWGEMVPFYLQRLDDMIPPQVSGLSRSITDTFKQHVYVTPSGMLNSPHFEFIQKVLGVERILYSIDYPYLTLAGARRFLESLAISQEEKEQIAHGNAERLFRL